MQWLAPPVSPDLQRGIARVYVTWVNVGSENASFTTRGALSLVRLGREVWGDWFDGSAGPPETDGEGRGKGADCFLR